MGNGSDLPVNNVRDTVVQDGVGERDPRIVHPGRTIGQNSKRQVSALETRDCNVAKRRGEDDVVGDDVVGENLLERFNVHRFEHGANVREGFVGGDEDGVVGQIQGLSIGSGQAKLDA